MAPGDDRVRKLSDPAMSALITGLGFGFASLLVFVAFGLRMPWVARAAVLVVAGTGIAVVMGYRAWVAQARQSAL